MVMKDTPRVRPDLLTRRAFSTGGLASLLLARAGSSHGAEPAPKSPPGGKWKAGIIGHTGEGDYGHGLDVLFDGRDDVEVVAIADPVETGRAAAAVRSKAQRQYADAAEMLAREKPQLVCLASRWTHERHGTALAGLRGGAHLLSEKPFTTTLAEADELLEAASGTGARIAVAHQMRLAPSIQALHKAIREGLIGDLLEINGWGKQDDRAGGEDMIVLGSHVFDLMRLFAGDASWCTARVLQGGREITRADARKVKERIGPVTGDEISAQFAFPKGVMGTFTSRKALRQQTGHWGIELVGSKTSARILADVHPAVYVLSAGKWEPSGRSDQWQRFENDPGARLTPEARGFGPANRRVVDDWLEAIQNEREPACSGHNATKSLEMIMAVYHAGLSGSRIAFPLADRSHPLGA